MNMLADIARWVKAATVGAFMAGALAACGGGGGSGGTPVLGGGGGGGTTPTPTAAALSVELSSATISNSGAGAITVTATALDANRAVVGNVPVTFAVDNGAVIAPAGTKTDATTGKVTAGVTIGADRTNRTVNVTVTSGNLTQKVAFDVVDSISGSKVADLSMVLDKTSIPNDGTQTLKLTLTSLDAFRVAIGGAPVQLKLIDPSNNAFLTASGTKTDDVTGQLTATVSLGSTVANRSISLQAISGTVERVVTFSVITPTISIPKANDLAVVLDKASLNNSGSERMTVTVTAVDASRNVVPGIPVAFTADNGAIVTVTNSTTNAQGQAIATVQTGPDRSNRLITVTVSSETLVRSASFNVIGGKLIGSAVPTQPAAGSTGNKIEYRLVDVNEIGMTDLPFTVSAPGLPTMTGRTNSRGAFEYTYTAPTTAGPIDVTAVAGGVSTIVTVTVPSSSSTVPPASPAVVSASVSTSPSVVSVNTDATDNRTELRAIFLAANNAPVKNVRVRFDLDGDANSIGGTISSGTALLYSDANGTATSNYKPGNRASPTSGVTIRACWGYTDAELANNACPNSVKTTLTVVSDPLSITIGTNETIDTTGSSGLTYIKRYVLLVVDAAGNPKPDVQITPSVDLISYRKGFYVWNGVRYEPWHYLDGVLTSGLSAACKAEDDNRNGAIDTGEDRNTNGQLDPRKSDVAISMEGSTRTGTSGTGILKLEYPKNLASFVDFVISASAFGVLSPPAYYSGPLPVDADAIVRETPPPAFVRSPYGIYRKSSDLVYCTNAD